MRDTQRIDIAAGKILKGVVPEVSLISKNEYHIKKEASRGRIELNYYVEK